VVDKIRAAAGGSLEAVPVAVWGLTFKANTDDLRDSPALAVAAQLLDERAVVRGFDPVAGETAARALPKLDVVPDPYEACDGARVLAVLTEWDEFRWLDFDRVAERMATRSAIVDARNVLDPAAMRRRGFAYQGIGR
jgi:UDPglucose 6-dehydrogenase